MPLRDEVLVPIPGANPCGVSLRYDPLYDKIKEARKEEDELPQGEYKAERKVADWPQVIRLTKDALTTKSKDLELAVWLAEAMLRREGFSGFKAALDTIVGLLEQHWDHLYPEIDDGDLEMRAAPLEWLGSAGGAARAKMGKLEIALKRVPLDSAGHDFIQMQNSRGVPTETEAKADQAKGKARQALLAEGKKPPEEFEKAFQETPKPWLKALVAGIDGTVASLQNLDEISQERFGAASPSYRQLREVIEEVQRTAKQHLKRKLELEPDPVEETPATPEEGGVALPEGVVLPGSVGAQLSAVPTSAEDAASRVAAAAKYLRQNEPTNPAPYLLLRGLRWGELRASGREPEPRLLEAPPTQTRAQLKALMLDSKWDALLEACEGVMATPQGRGWLDLQRYSLTACEELGAGYQMVAASIRSALKSLLEDIPGLPTLTLMDDTPTANAETRAWLKALVGSGAAAPNEADGALPFADTARGRDPRVAALAEARAGRTDRAIALLVRETGSEKSNRGRFMMQTELASIMIGAGHHAVAQPILEELKGRIDTHKLEDWESGDVVARPLALLYRCLELAKGDANARQALYLRICRLDPLQAIGATNGGATK